MNFERKTGIRCEREMVEKFSPDRMRNRSPFFFPFMNACLFVSRIFMSTAYITDYGDAVVTLMSLFIRPSDQKVERRE